MSPRLFAIVSERQIYCVRGGEVSAIFDGMGEKSGTCRPAFFYAKMVALKPPVFGDFRRSPQRARAVSGR
jgi:hypothetical protein